MEPLYFELHELKMPGEVCIFLEAKGCAEIWGIKYGLRNSLEDDINITMNMVYSWNTMT
jgi:hypothetical protein